MISQVMAQPLQQLLAQAIVKEGLKNVAAGANPMDLKRGNRQSSRGYCCQLGQTVKESW